MNKSGSITTPGAGIRITVTRAEHSSELVWKNPATGTDKTHVGGEPAGFIIKLENGSESDLRQRGDARAWFKIDSASASCWRMRN